MGSGHYSADVYTSTIGATRAAGGDTFAYSTHTIHHTPFEERKAHQTLDPDGVEYREARDSDEHPLSVPIAVFFDVTGSMHHAPRQLQADLPNLLEQITLGGYCTDPQILMGAVTDANNPAGNRIPLQIGQFESDNRIDQNLADIVLEGGGGGGNHESYELIFYFLARMTVTDAWDKRGKRGYAFIIGDERSYEELTPAEVSRVFGHDIPQEIPLDDLIAEAQQRWEIFFVHPGGTSYFGEGDTKDFWTGRLGQNYVQVPSVDVVGESIAKLIGGMEAGA